MTAVRQGREYAGCASAVAGLFFHTKQERGICMILAIVFLMSAVIQLMMFKKSPRLFDDKSKELREN